MSIQRCEIPSFSVIGREGSTNDGTGFVERLWAEANANFSEVEGLARKDQNGALTGLWGAMSDFSRAFLPWEKDFSEGLYLAGVEVIDQSEAPNGWTKWIIPGFEYVYLENQGPESFREGLQYLHENDLPLAGAVQDFTCPQEKKNYLFFPIRKL